MHAVDISHRRAIHGLKANAYGRRWCWKLGEKRWCERIRRHCGSPAQDTPVVVVLAPIRNAQTLARRSAEAGRYRARSKARTAGDMMMVVQNRDGELHAESDQREPNQSKTGLRCCHPALKLFPLAMSLPILCHHRGGRSRWRRHRRPGAAFIPQKACDTLRDISFGLRPYPLGTKGVRQHFIVTGDSETVWR
jgi:hypothetical protein